MNGNRQRILTQYSNLRNTTAIVTWDLCSYGMLRSVYC